MFTSRNIATALQESLYGIAILTAALALQMAAMAKDSNKAEHFGKLAMQLSRKHENYQLERIEATNYQVVGHNVNFAELIAELDSLASEFSSLTTEEAIERSEALATNGWSCIGNRGPLGGYRKRRK